ncbi:MAG: hypothetical protein C4547_02290 [Phycisphaerales bacterium]|nr:MAG: hypothetical protein C4547_02290 [Phycisphaerales bacterium]
MMTISLLAQMAPVEGLTFGGAAVMACSFLIVGGLSAFCLYRILRESTPAEHHHTPLDIDTQDRDT